MADNDQELVDYAIVPHSRIQHYESTIENQQAEINRLQEQVNIPPEEVKLKDDVKVESPAEEVKKKDDEKVENKEEKVESSPSEDVGGLPKSDTVEPLKEEVTDVSTEPSKQEVAKIQRGKNINRQCLTRQLKHKLQEAGCSLPENVDLLLKSATGSSTKILRNENEFYNAIMSNNLVSLVTNKAKFDYYIRPKFFKI